MDPNFDHEREFWDQGVKIVAGTDEVGRGALAGPVVASCVVFAPINNFQFTIYKNSKKILIRDSKKLTFLQRCRADEWIRENALSFGIGEASVTEINRLGIVGATNKAFRRAISNIQSSIETLLVDAFYVPYVNGISKKYQRAIIKGDNISLSIAASSIVAKVYRDNLMRELGNQKQFIQYCWRQNKGYGTKTHREAILSHGPCKLHRKQFVSSLVSFQARSGA